LVFRDILTYSLSHLSDAGRVILEIDSYVESDLQKLAFILGFYYQVTKDLSQFDRHLYSFSKFRDSLLDTVRKELKYYLKSPPSLFLLFSVLKDGENVHSAKWFKEPKGKRFLVKNKAAILCRLVLASNMD